METISHLTASQLAGYLDNDLSPTEVEGVVRHLDNCPTCRGELAELVRLSSPDAPASSGRSGPRPVRRWWIPVLVAAGLGGIFLARREGALAPPTIERPSVDPSASYPTITTVAPRDGARVAASGLAFTWRSRPADSYRITVMTETGEEVWRYETSDTAVRLPPSVVLRGGATYFWRVEAIADGITASTGVQRVDVEP